MACEVGSQSSNSTSFAAAAPALTYGFSQPTTGFGSLWAPVTFTFSYPFSDPVSRVLFLCESEPPGLLSRRHASRFVNGHLAARDHKETGTDSALLDDGVTRSEPRPPQPAEQHLDLRLSEGVEQGDTLDEGQLSARYIPDRAGIPSPRILLLVLQTSARTRVPVTRKPTGDLLVIVV